MYYRKIPFNRRFANSTPQRISYRSTKLVTSLYANKKERMIRKNFGSITLLITIIISASSTSLIGVLIKTLIPYQQ